MLNSLLIFSEECLPLMKPDLQVHVGVGERVGGVEYSKHFVTVNDICRYVYQMGFIGPLIWQG